MSVQWECSVCGKYQKKKGRKSKIFCSLSCYEKSLIKKCKFCGKPFKSSIQSVRYCDDCKKSPERSSHYYKHHLVEKECKNCSKIFMGREKVILCNECKKKLPNPLIHHYPTICRSVICPKCHKEIRKEEIKLSWRTKPFKVNKGQCKDCKEEVRLQSGIVREQKKEARNEKRRAERALLKEQRTIKRREDSERRKKIFSEKASLRMKANNPMFKKETRLKVSQTLRKKIQNGDIKYKKGVIHHLWKGNRGFNMDCRNRLYKTWTFPVLQRDKFQCTLCDEHRNLQVHHVVELRKIISEILEENNVEKIIDIDSKSCQYENLIQQVVDDHRLSYGITVCKKCHGEIDERYRRYRKAK